MILYEGQANVWYHSYYLGDPYRDEGLPAAINDSDGLLGVAPGTAAVATGTPAGVIELRINLVDELPPLPTEQVASQCQLELPTGLAEVYAAETDSDWSHDFGHAVVLGVQVIARGRDEGAENTGVTEIPVERHEIYLCETDGAVRAQSPATDHVLHRRRSLQRRYHPR